MFKKISFFSLGIIFFSVSLLAAAFGQRIENDTANSPAQPQTVINHVIVVIFENRESTAITAATAPNFTNFAATYANLTNYYGVTHPSQPNYLDIFSGSNQGVLDDGHYSVAATVDNLAKQMTAAGKSWRIYAQGFPGNCFNNDTFAGGIDGAGVAGQYVRKHNPAMTFQSVTANPAECANVQPLANFDPSVNFAFVVPNLINDMHDGTTAQGDAFLQQFLPQVLNSADFAHTLLIVTFDEGSTGTNGGGHIYTAAAAPWLHNKTVPTLYNHYNLLHTIEQIFNLPYLNNAASATTMRELLPPAPSSAFDYDGDGKSDVSVFRPSAGAWFLNQSTNGLSGVNFGQNGDLITPADFDGDGKTDIGVFRGGNWYRLNSSNGQFVAVQFGQAGDIPAAGDFDGDGKADISVFRPSSGTWYRLNSSNGQFVGVQFGQANDKPQVADFDSDGKTDIAVFRPSSGTWFYLRSSDNSLTGVTFGQSGDVPTASDFDGDGRADIAVFRPSNGTWYRLNSSDGQFVLTAFGTSEDKPVAADFDGDGRADIAVYRPSVGAWYLLRSTQGFAGQQFGASGDVPTQTAFGQ